jgi:hypothetical protein
VKKATGKSKGFVFSPTGWLLAIAFVALGALGSRCTSVHIGDEKISVFRDDTPFFRRRKYENSTTRFINDHFWSGRTRHDAVIRTDSGNIAVPKGSSIDKTESITGPVVFVLKGELECRGKLTLFDHAIDQPLRSVSVTQGGQITGFAVRGEAVKMEISGVAFEARSMVWGTRFDPQSKSYATPYRQYFYFDCTGMDPVRIDRSSGIAFAGGEEKRFAMTVEENDYGFYAWTLTSPSGKSFVVEHPFLEGETGVYEVRFDRFYDKVLAYTVNSGDEETVIPYEESNLSVEGKSDEELFAKLLREALWRNQNKTDE